MSDELIPPVYYRQIRPRAVPYVNRHYRVPAIVRARLRRRFSNNQAAIDNLGDDLELERLRERMREVDARILGPRGSVDDFPYDRTVPMEVEPELPAVGRVDWDALGAAADNVARRARLSRKRAYEDGDEVLRRVRRRIAGGAAAAVAAGVGYSAWPSNPLLFVHQSPADFSVAPVSRSSVSGSTRRFRVSSRHPFGVFGGRRRRRYVKRFI